MKEWYNRNKNRILAFMCAFCVCFSVMGFDSLAAEPDYIFEVPYSQPSVSSTQGYLNVLYQRDSGAVILVTYFWNCSSFSSVDQTENSYVNITFDTTASSIQFEFVQNTSTSNKFYSFGSFNNSGNIGKFAMETFDGVATHTITSAYEIISYQVYGNFGEVSGGPNYTSTSFEVIYGGDSALYDTLNEILVQLTISNDFYTTYFPKLNQILLNVTQIEDINQALLDLQNEMMPQFLEYFEKIYNDHGEMLASIDSSTYAIWRAIVEQNSTDSELVNDLKENSNAQSNELNNLNETMEEEQNRTDIDSASSEVDANLDLDAVGSYGTLLSSFTNNQYVVQILLATLSVALISYVFFGKR